MPTIIACCSQKGGCGKTTTSLTLASGLTRVGYSVLVVDADRQQNAVSWRLTNKGAPFAFDMISMAHASIHEDLPRLSARQGYEVVIVDCPPGIAHGDDIARSALECANVALVPIRPSRADLNATVPFVQMLAQINGRRPDLHIAAFCNAMARGRVTELARKSIAGLFAELPRSKVLDATIGVRMAILEATWRGVTVLEDAPRSAAAAEYNRLTKELLAWLATLAV